MEKWILVSDAAKKLCCHGQKIYEAATEHKWEHKLGDPPKNGGKTPRLFRVKDVMRLKEYRERGDRKVGQKKTYYQAIEIVDWADSLESYPSIEEIEKHTTFTYRVHDIESVIENRVARGFAELKMV